MHEGGVDEGRVGNIYVVELADDGPISRAERGPDGVVRCAASQVLVDLLAGPEPVSREAGMLESWMRSNEARWRRTST